MKHVNIQVKYKILLYIIICKDIETYCVAIDFAKWI